ncbi:hypothetical protein M8C21_023509 [Ambrosia artemisiifolia]|uniref:Uncharacterized protein n=1 Tax=Ambrosia artemisiifolia TaxID=4212 RepID=A0AAD5CWZ7_AMBAR|nr:hypothetical protein M8C21_023509 [Ambrosia artemisiifolia]
MINGFLKTIIDTHKPPHTSAHKPHRYLPYIERGNRKKEREGRGSRWVSRHRSRRRCFPRTHLPPLSPPKVLERERVGGCSDDTDGGDTQGYYMVGGFGEHGTSEGKAVENDTSGMGVEDGALGNRI